MSAVKTINGHSYMFSQHHGIWILMRCGCSGIGPHACDMPWQFAAGALKDAKRRKARPTDWFLFDHKLQELEEDDLSRR